jgi:hypothetical protein
MASACAWIGDLMAMSLHGRRAGCHLELRPLDPAGAAAPVSVRRRSAVWLLRRRPDSKMQVMWLTYSGYRTYPPGTYECLEIGLDSVDRTALDTFSARPEGYVGQCHL